MANESYWRSIAAPIIREIIQEVGADNPRQLAAALRDAYPWGEKRMHPYRIWRDEIRRQLNPSPSTAMRRRQYVVPDGQMTFCNDGATMAPLWRYDDPIGEEPSSPPNPVS